MEKFRFTTLDEIKPLLRHGDVPLITEMLKGVYSRKTIESQLNGNRTLKEKVIEAANKLIEFREQLIS